MLLKVYILLAFIYVFICTCGFVHMYVFYYINLTKSKATDLEKTVVYTWQISTRRDHAAPWAEEGEGV